MAEAPPDSAGEAALLRRRLERERKVRLQAEALSEKGLRELYESTQRLELLEKIAAAANQGETAATGLHLALVEICRFTGWDVGHVLRIEGIEEARHLRSAALWHGAEAPEMAEFRAATEATAFAAGVGLPGRAFSTAAAAWIADLAADENFPRDQAARRAGLRAACAFPVLSGDTIVAVMEFFSRVAREPDETLLRLMSQIGLQLGRAVERQRDTESVQRRAEALLHARNKAESANRAKSEFLANMSHELRTPLNSIIGFSELMMNETFGPHNVEAYRDYSRHIHDSGQHLLAIINDILNLSKIEAGKAELGPEEAIAPQRLLKALGDSLRVLAEQRGIALNVAIAPKLPHLVGSERMVRQILTNLLSNALKFTPAGGRVDVSAALVAGGGLAIAVADSGVGMSEAEIQVALTPFGQVDGTLSRRHDGTGLGLPLARAMTLLHQAEFTLTSSPGAGTRVAILFPVSRLRWPTAPSATRASA